jgi:hypothetical protein
MVQGYYYHQSQELTRRCLPYRSIQDRVTVEAPESEAEKEIGYLIKTESLATGVAAVT